MAELRKTGLEERMAKVEGILEQIEKRLNHIETALTSLWNEIRDLRSEIRGDTDGLRDEIGKVGSESRSSIKSLYNLIIIMWVTIILALGGLFITIILG